MKKYIIIVICICSLAFGAWSYFSKPTFEGLNAELKGLLWDWSQAKSDLEKYDSAKRLSYKKFYQNKRTLLTDDEDYHLDSAKLYYEDLIKSAQEFERNLTKRQVEFITQDNLSSIYRSINDFFISDKNWISSSDLQMLKCINSDFESLKNDLGIELLRDRGSSIMALNAATEGLFHESYIKRIIELIDSETELKSKYKLLASTYYLRFIEPSEYTNKTIKKYSVFGKIHYKKRIANYREELINSGVKSSNVDQYAKSMGVKYPNCFIKLSLGLLEKIRNEYRFDRTQKMINYLTELRDNNLELPNSIYEDEVLSNLSTYLEIPLFIKKTKTKLYLISEGDDFTANTADDVKAAELDLN